MIQHIPSCNNSNIICLVILCSFTSYLSTHPLNQPCIVSTELLTQILYSLCCSSSLSIRSPLTNSLQPAFGTFYPVPHAYLIYYRSCLFCMFYSSFLLPTLPAPLSKLLYVSGFHCKFNLFYMYIS